MKILLILLSLAALCLGVFGWLWLIAGFRRGGWRGGIGRAALQISALCLLWGVLTGAPIVGIYKAVLPLLAVPDVVWLAGFGPFLTLILWRAAPVAGLVLVPALVWRPLRPWAPGLAVAALMIGALVLGDAVSRQAMCDAAQARGLTDLRRDMLANSLARRPELGPHGLAHGGGQVWGWSYDQMDWFALPFAKPAEGSVAAFNCA